MKMMGLGLNFLISTNGRRPLTITKSDSRRLGQSSMSMLITTISRFLMFLSQYSKSIVKVKKQAVKGISSLMGGL